MNPLTGPIWAALALLVVAGAPKVTKPFDLQRALRLAGLRVSHPVIRVFGAVEAVIGLLGLLTGHRVLLGLAVLSYLGFAGFVGYALTRATPLSSCGCFGKADTPPTRTHLVVVAALAVCLLIGAVSGAPGVLTATGGLGFVLLTLGYSAIICWFGYLVLALMPTAVTRPNSPLEPAASPDHSVVSSGTGGTA